MRRIRASRRVGLLLGGVLLLGFVAIALTVVVPATDPVLAEAERKTEMSGEASRGMELYAAEGCWYCHSLQVRDVTSDSPLGEPLDADDYAALQPAMLGLERVGPDLTHVADRRSAEEIVRALRSPRRDDRSSTMPSYTYLSGADLEALAAFLLSFE